jgi:hypothetical protein
MREFGSQAQGAKRGRSLANLRQHANQQLKHYAIAFARNPMRNLVRDFMPQGFRQRQPVGRRGAKRLCKP